MYINDYGTSPAFVSTANNSGNEGFEIRQSGSTNKTLDFYFGDGSVFTSSANDLPEGSWFHVVCTYDGTTLKQYIDALYSLYSY